MTAHKHGFLMEAESNLEHTVIVLLHGSTFKITQCLPGRRHVAQTGWPRYERSCIRSPENPNHIVNKMQHAALQIKLNKQNFQMVKWWNSFPEIRNKSDQHTTTSHHNTHMYVHTHACSHATHTHAHRQSNSPLGVLSKSWLRWSCLLVSSND